MILKLKYFGMIGETLGKEAEELDVQVADVSDLMEHYGSKLNNISYKVAVNQSLVEPNHPLKENDEVALLPPFAGG